MNNELARELKEAGFPLKPHFERGRDTADNMYKIPTLSELIEACGDKFFRLEKMMEGWEARGAVDNEFEGWPWGKTSEEAVARLWLALNKHE